MARKKVIWTDFAKKDFKETLNFYNERNKNNFYSKKLLKRIRSIAKLVALQPLLGTATEFQGIRVIGTNPFQIHYKAEEKRIVILLIWDARRDPEELKKIISSKE